MTIKANVVDLLKHTHPDKLKAAGLISACDAQNEPKTNLDEWEGIITFGKALAPGFPIEHLPDWLRDYIIHLSNYLQVPVDLPASFVLAVFATASQGKFVVKVNKGWRESLSLYIMCIASSASAKSPIYKEVTTPLRTFEQEEITRLGPEIQKAASLRRIKEQRLKELEQKAVKDAEFEIQAANLASEVSMMVERGEPRITTADATPEAIERLLSEQNGRLAVFSSESGGIISIMSGRYRSGGSGNIDVFLKAYSGDDIRVDRIGRKALHIPNPTLTMGLFCQPSVMEEFVCKREFQDKGLLNRFFYSYPASNIGTRRFFGSPYTPEEIRQRYIDSILKLCRLNSSQEVNNKITAIDLELSEDAFAEFKNFCQRLEAELGENGDLYYLQGWAGKGRGHVLRIAGLLHLIKNWECHNPGDLLISREIILDAIALFNYFKDHVKIVFSIEGAGTDTSFEVARRIIKFIKKNRLKELERNHLFKSLRNTQVSRTRDLDTPLEILVERNYIRIKQENKDPEERRKGGRPKEIYEVNPEVLSTNT